MIDISSAIEQIDKFRGAAKNPEFLIDEGLKGLTPASFQELMVVHKNFVLEPLNTEWLKNPLGQKVVKEVLAITWPVLDSYLRNPAKLLDKMVKLDGMGKALEKEGAIDYVNWCANGAYWHVREIVFEEMAQIREIIDTNPRILLAEFIALAVAYGVPQDLVMEHYLMELQKAGVCGIWVIKTGAWGR